MYASFDFSLFSGSHLTTEWYRGGNVAAIVMDIGISWDDDLAQRDA
jgi:hypothetical protein